MKFFQRICALVALLPMLAWAQVSPGAAPSSRRLSSPVSSPSAPALSAAAREGIRLAEQGCVSDGYEAEVCEKAIARLEEAARQSPAQVELQLALAQAYWNRSFQEGADSSARQRWQQRSMDVYQGLVDGKVEDARPYYELSMRQQDAARRLPLLRRTVELNPRHPRAHQDLAWNLLRQGRADEAWESYAEHMEASPVKDRQEAQENLRFAHALSRAKRPRQAAEVVEKMVEQTKDERRAERCLLFQSVDPRLSEARPQVKRELEELRPYCTDTAHLDRAVELEQQGRTD